MRGESEMYTQVQIPSLPPEESITSRLVDADVDHQASFGATRILKSSELHMFRGLLLYTVKSSKA